MFSSDVSIALLSIGSGISFFIHHRAWVCSWVALSQLDFYVNKVEDTELLLQFEQCQSLLVQPCWSSVNITHFKLLRAFHVSDYSPCHVPKVTFKIGFWSLSLDLITVTLGSDFCRTTPVNFLLIPSVLHNFYFRGVWDWQSGWEKELADFSKSCLCIALNTRLKKTSIVHLKKWVAKSMKIMQRVNHHPLPPSHTWWCLSSKSSASPAIQACLLQWVVLCPPKRYSDVLTPSTCEYDLTWK